MRAVLCMSAVILTVIALASCSTAPKYERPAVSTPPAYKEAENFKVAQPRDEVRRGKWWEIFSDARLNGLMEQIDISNQNVRLAEAQFRQARALVQQARAGLFPTVDGSFSTTRSASRPSSNLGSRAGNINNDYALSLDASWEPDLWGRVRGSVNANVASAQASAALIESARLSAQAELALNYFQLRVLDVERTLLQDSVGAFAKSLELTRNRYAAGVAGRLDVVQAEAQLNSTRAQLVDVGVQRAQVEHAIAVLLGKAPAEFGLPPEKVNLATPPIPVGLPSELLERRPDIAAAERRVAAANAQIGVAKAAYFPSLTLSASGGFAGSRLADLLSVPNRVWAIGASIAQSIFDAGLRRSLTEQAIAAYDANVASYRLTVLTAFQDVEDHLAALRILEEEAAVQEQAIRSARQTLELTLNQYKAGTASYLNVAIVQQALLNNERTGTAILGRRLAAAVALVRALGGGWTGELPGEKSLR